MFNTCQEAVMSSCTYVVNKGAISEYFQASTWCKKGMDMLANQQLSEIDTPETAAQAIRDIEVFIATVKDLKLNNPKEFRQLFDGMITSEVRVREHSTYLSLITRKPVFGVSDQDRLKAVCAATEAR